MRGEEPAQEERGKRERDLERAAGAGVVAHGQNGSDAGSEVGDNGAAGVLGPMRGCYEATRWAALTRPRFWDSSPGRYNSRVRPQTRQSPMPFSRLVSAPQSGSRRSGLGR